MMMSLSVRMLTGFNEINSGALLQLVETLVQHTVSMKIDFTIV